MDCRYIRNGLLEFVGRELKVFDFAKYCTVTLPVKTLDGRFLDVYVEKPQNGYSVAVHDGGRTASELYAQGVHLTDSKRAVFGALA